jgi:hypothetical protein
MIHLAIPVAIIAAVKLFFVIHGLTISVAAMEAGYRAHNRGDDVIEAALTAGATRAAAVLLSDALRKYC